VPDQAPDWLLDERIVLEIFAGEAVFTQACATAGLFVLPPVEIEMSDWVPVPVDITDEVLRAKIMRYIEACSTLFVHFGTPCSSFSCARKYDDDGPNPIRSAEFLDGIPGISAADAKLVATGSALMELTVDLCLFCSQHGAHWSIENPASSLLWKMPAMLNLKVKLDPTEVAFDQCQFGTLCKKPTVLWSSLACLVVLARACPGVSGSHHHVQLKGKVWSAKHNRMVWRTKLAQVYPEALCSEWAGLLACARYSGEHRSSSLDLDFDIQQRWAKTFALVTPLADRKRPLGTPTRFVEHRQAVSGARAVGAGYQMKRAVVPPLFLTEMEPGQAVQHALSVIHPFTQEPELDPGLQYAVQRVCSAPEAVCKERMCSLQFWQQRARELLPETARRISAVPDVHLRRLLWGSDSSLPELGKICHLALWEEMLSAAKCVDVDLVPSFVAGMPIVGDIARSRRWLPLQRDKPLSMEDLRSRAWEVRRKIISRVSSTAITQHSIKLWEATISDRDEGSCLGPFYDEAEVSKLVGTEQWIPTQRFEVVQKGKVRGVDSATVNLVNTATRITEKLDLPSTDLNVATIRAIRSATGDQTKIGGWVLDERRAYRQVPILPEHRRYSVISFRHYGSGKVVFFVMVGHSFGLVSAVYNYNRRSAAISDILRNVFSMVAFNFYDDKYGFEPVNTLASAQLVAEEVHFMLGARYDAEKLQFSAAPVILGVTYDLEEFVLLIKQDRKEELTDQIQSILDCGVLEPGEAGKLRGKLMFGASQLWGKVGRAFLRVISERQYSHLRRDFALSEALILALKQWQKLINHGQPRPISRTRPSVAEAVVFTDGYTPDQRLGESGISRTGGVVFDRCSRDPVQFSEPVAQSVIDFWMPRKTQIVMIELVAVILAIETFKQELAGKFVLLLIDSEAVEAALIKGYSSKEDICELVGVFWDMALEHNISFYVDRVPTDANPADAPSRADLVQGVAAGWITRAAVWPRQIRPSGMGKG